ncbi:choline-binding protein C [Streptococcus mitis]|jgi:choline binding protein cbp10|uniref:choline-binding protein C n=1 Tax=Streptococcus mitis TaxID=28037 RepID=UPI0019315D72|nr:choline-binding protein C [Streptococcus mitis]
MRNRKMLASSLLAGALLSIGYVASKPTTVHALTDMSVKDTQNPLKITLIPTTGNPFYSGSVLVDIQRNSSTDNPSLYYDLVNEDTGAIVASYNFNSFGDQTRSQSHVWLLYAEDGRYHIDVYSEKDFGKRYFGRSEVFKVSNHGYVPITNSETPTATETPKQSTNSNSNSNSAQTGWSGSSYYKAGVKVVNQWIFDVQYNSYFYLNASGNYVQNAWSGNYYLKSGGYMAKSEWIYDKNYSSYYYLTSEGSYARNTWVGSYYLKSNGKMAKSEWVYDSSYQSYYYLTSEGSYARNTWIGDYYLKSNGKLAVNERTPDGYKVDGSGKWVK